jgi:hypothetical protein
MSKKRSKNIIKSLKLNYIFYISLLLSLMIISYFKNINFIWAIVTIIIVSFLGYITHVISHSVNFRYYYTKLNIPNSFIEGIVNILDFHEDIHHDSSVNKHIQNSAAEFVCNFITQAGIIMLTKFLFSNFNYSIILLWGFMYSTVHMINYTLFPNDTHIKHHMELIYMILYAIPSMILLLII